MHQPNECLCDQCFTVYKGEYGILFSAPIPCEDLLQLAIYYSKRYGYDLCDGLIACKTGSAICLTNAELSHKWREQLLIDS